jgi:nicotinamide mononucleotide transporter
MNEIALFLNTLNFNWSIIECVAVFFSILYIILAAKENIWCWGAGVISASLYIYICLFAQLYSQTGLQIFYLFIAFYGYYHWNKKEQSLQIIEWSIGKHLFILAIGSILTFLMGFYFTTYTNAKIPIADSFTTVFSIFATYMVAKKILGNWLYWIVIDTVAAYLYFSAELHLTSLLFVSYAIIAIFGYFSWMKKIKIDA